MAFASVITLLAFLLLQTLSATKDVCKGVECGKGTCKPPKNGTSLFECECNPGWKQASSSGDEGFKFLPCIVPNCTLNYTCSKAPAPVQQKERKANESIFNACHWVDCGGGSCNKTSLFSYSCQCNAGYYNLFNATAFPCFRECALGLGCSNLGISLTNSSTAAPPPTLDDNGKNEASSIVRGHSLWLLMLIIFMANIQLQWHIW